MAAAMHEPSGSPVTAPASTPAARSERIYRALRERISLLEYPPGHVLEEVELAREFGVSRTPVREVLQRLSHDGLVETRNGVGTTITEIDLETFKDVYALRMRLAGLMDELSPVPRSQVDARALQPLLGRARALGRRRDLGEYARICQALEDVLLSTIGNQPLRETKEPLYCRSARAWLSVLSELDWQEACDALCDELTEVVGSPGRATAREASGACAGGTWRSS